MQNNLDSNYSLRGMQAVLQSGVGGMTDFPSQSLMMARPEDWRAKKNIFDDRFAKALGVTHFASPLSVGFVRFPRWYYCPKCHKFQDIDKWISLYRRIDVKHSESDPDMVSHMNCPLCRYPLVPASFVTACPSGHIDDFPWIEWLHIKANKPLCSNPELSYLQLSADGMEGLYLTCKCGTKSSLKTILHKDELENCGKKIGHPELFLCKGHFHFNNKTDEKCGFYPKVFGRGSSSMYFPLTFSSLLIPPFADKLRTKIEQSNSFDSFMEMIEQVEANEEKEKVFEEWKDRFANKIAEEIGARKEEVLKILEEKWERWNSDDTIETDNLKYKMDEYDALNGSIKSMDDGGDFLRVEKDVAEYNIPHLKSVALIEKVRVVSTMVGFSRVNPVTSMEDVGFVDAKEKRTDWYPANEVRGEGIFLEFKEEDIADWIIRNPSIVDRAKQLERNAGKTSVWKVGHRITPKFLLLHTLSHLLIRQLSFECGYGIASLNERLYCADRIDGKEMAGIFIYTANGDSEGTLGGLVRQGQPDVLPNVIKRAVSMAFSCSNDPICAMSKGQGREALNLAACYACTLLPETCCEERNALLDRAMVVGTFENREIGFFGDLDRRIINPGISPKEIIGGTWRSKPQLPNNEVDNPPAEEIKIKYLAGDLLAGDYNSWEEASALFEGIDIEKLRDKMVDLPSRFGGKFVINNEKGINIVAVWDDRKAVLLEEMISEDEERAIQKAGWNILQLNEE